MVKLLRDKSFNYKNFIYKTDSDMDMANGKLTTAKSEIIYLEIEKSRINREKSKVVLDKSFTLYFSFLLVGAVGFAFDYVDTFLLNILIIAGIVILVLGTLPYVLIVHKEEKKINALLEGLKNA